MTQIEYATATVSMVAEIGQNGGGYIILDIDKSFGKPVDSGISMTARPQLRLDLVEGVKMGDKVKILLEVER